MTTATGPETFVVPHDGPIVVAPDISNLTPVGGRPTLPRYVRSLWGFRSFSFALIHAELRQRTTRDALGAAWYVLAPLLQSAVYFLVFAVLLHTVGSEQNPVLFLSTGVFTFAFTSRGLTAAAKSVNGNATLVRSLRFPRAVLPLMSVGVEVALLVPTFAVLTVIALVSGERPSFYWLLIPVILALQTGFVLGLGFVLARLAVGVPDVVQMMPFLLRLWLYLSGVFYSFAHIDTSAHPVAGTLLMLNPMRAFIELVRNAYAGAPSPLDDWVLALLWPLGFVLVGIVVFWKAEESYGR